MLQSAARLQEIVPDAVLVGRERAEVAAEVAGPIERTGLPVSKVARRIGTSRSRRAGEVTRHDLGR
ncbi:MAG: hypothetical protein ACRCZD_21965 [Phycicoccus sp.]